MLNTLLTIGIKKRHMDIKYTCTELEYKFSKLFSKLIYIIFLFQLSPMKYLLIFMKFNHEDNISYDRYIQWRFTLLLEVNAMQI